LLLESASKSSCNPGIETACQYCATPTTANIKPKATIPTETIAILTAFSVLSRTVVVFGPSSACCSFSSFLLPYTKRIKPITATGKPKNTLTAAVLRNAAAMMITIPFTL